MTNPQAGPDALPPHAQLVQMGTAHWVSHLVYAAADLGLADHLAKGPKTADELAGATKTGRPGSGISGHARGHDGGSDRGTHP